MKVIGVTNRKLCKDFYKRIDEISSWDLQYLILREKDLDYDALLIMAKKISSILNGSGIKFIINSNKKLAKEIGAYGLQLGYKEFLREGKDSLDGIVGVSIHSLNEAIDVERLGADYAIYGHIYETKCKEGLKPRGLNELEEICKSVSIPVYAIGGINNGNYKEVMETGVSGIAIMSSLMQNEKLI